MTATAELTAASKRAGTWTLLGLLLFLCAAVVVFPLIIIRPFVHQAALPLNLALLAQRWGQWITLVGFLSGVILVARSWARRSERFGILKDALLVATLAGLGLCAWASRVNIYERLMFRPLGNVRMVSAAASSVRPDDMVIVVSINGDDRAYPVLEMAYHHVVNDVVGGVPIVSTY
jgi:hypothetical protein